MTTPDYPHKRQCKRIITTFSVTAVQQETEIIITEKFPIMNPGKKKGLRQTIC